MALDIDDLAKKYIARELQLLAEQLRPGAAAPDDREKSIEPAEFTIWGVVEDAYGRKTPIPELVRAVSFEPSASSRTTDGLLLHWKTLIRGLEVPAKSSRLPNDPAGELPQRRLDDGSLFVLQVLLAIKQELPREAFIVVERLEQLADYLLAPASYQPTARPRANTIPSMYLEYVAEVRTLTYRWARDPRVQRMIRRAFHKRFAPLLGSTATRKRHEGPDHDETFLSIPAIWDAPVVTAAYLQTPRSLLEGTAPLPRVLSASEEYAVLGSRLRRGVVFDPLVPGAVALRPESLVATCRALNERPPYLTPSLLVGTAPPTPEELAAIRNWFLRGTKESHHLTARRIIARAQRCSVDELQWPNREWLSVSQESFARPHRVPTLAELDVRRQQEAEFSLDPNRPPRVRARCFERVRLPPELESLGEGGFLRFVFSRSRHALIGVDPGSFTFATPDDINLRFLRAHHREPGRGALARLQSHYLLPVGAGVYFFPLAEIQQLYPSEASLWAWLRTEFKDGRVAWLKRQREPNVAAARAQGRRARAAFPFSLAEDEQIMRAYRRYRTPAATWDFLTQAMPRHAASAIKARARLLDLATYGGVNPLLQHSAELIRRAIPKHRMTPTLERVLATE